MSYAVGEVDVQPPLDVVRRSREDDLVEGLAAEALFDGVHRIMPDRHNAVHGAPCRFRDLRKRFCEHMLSFGNLVVTFRVCEVPLRRSRVGNENAKPCGAAGSAAPDRVKQRRRRRDAVDDHENALRIRGFHLREPTRST